MKIGSIIGGIVLAIVTNVAGFYFFLKTQGGPNSPTEYWQTALTLDGILQAVWLALAGVTVFWQRKRRPAGAADLPIFVVALVAAAVFYGLEWYGVSSAHAGDVLR